MNEVIRFESIVKVYPPNCRAINGLSISVQQHEFIRVFGGTGCGKTTLLKLVGGIELPSSGEVTVQNRSLHKMTEAERAVFRNKAIGHIQRNPGLINELPMLENVAMPLIIQRQSLKESRLIARVKMKRLNILHLKSAYSFHLSAFEAQLVSIARALVGMPQILLMDEILADLTKKEAGQIMHIIQNLWQSERLTILCCTSNISEMMSFGRNIVMSNGQFVEDHQ